MATLQAETPLLGLFRYFATQNREAIPKGIASLLDLGFGHLCPMCYAVGSVFGGVGGVGFGLLLRGARSMWRALLHSASKGLSSPIAFTTDGSSSRTLSIASSSTSSIEAVAWTFEPACTFRELMMSANASMSAWRSSMKLAGMFLLMNSAFSGTASAAKAQAAARRA